MINKIVGFTVIFFLYTVGFSQSPWVNNKGSFYGQVSATYLGYGSIINDKVNEIVEADFKTRDITATIYADYSLTNKMAVLVNLPYKMVEHNNQRLSSLGDPSIKLKYQLLKKIQLLRITIMEK